MKFYMSFITIFSCCLNINVTPPTMIITVSTYIVLYLHCGVHSKENLNKFLSHKGSKQNYILQALLDFLKMLRQPVKSRKARHAVP